MLFQDLKAGFYVFIFNKSTFEASRVRVTQDVQPPHYDNKSPYNNTTKVVDVCIDYNGPKIYTVTEGSDTGWFNDLTISTVKENITREIEAVMNSYQEDLKQVDFKKKGVEKCKEILSNWDDSYKEKKEQEERLTNIEGNIKDLQEGVGQMLKAINKLTKSIEDKE